MDLRIGAWVWSREAFDLQGFGPDDQGFYIRTNKDSITYCTLTDFAKDKERKLEHVLECKTSTCHPPLEP